MVHHILSVMPENDYMLHLTFDGGEERLFDLKPYLKGSLFLPLRDDDLFKRVAVGNKPRGLIWPNGADLCADMLYMNSQPYEGDGQMNSSHSRFAKIQSQATNHTQDRTAKRTVG